MAELATICYVDICKAATYVAKSDSPLGRLLPDIEAELRNQLFDPEKPLISDSLMSGLGIIIDHRTLLADCMVAMYRLNPRQALNKIFASCLDSRAPTLFKISLVKACLAIASEENKLPWNSSIVTLYDALAGPLRKLFVEFANKDIKEVVNRKLMLTDKRSKRDNLVRVDLNGERLELILDMLRLYQTDPKLAIRGDDEDRLEQNAMAMVAIANCLCEQDQYVRDAAAMCLFKLHSPDYILEWGPAPVFMETFWKIGSQILFALGKQLLDMREKDDSLKRLLDLLKRLFETRNEFLEKNQDSAVEGSDAKERLQCTIAMEIALLVLLCSSDIEICSAAIDCFGLICIEARLTDNFDHHSLLIAENLPIYSELSTNNGIVTGRKSQQKQIRRLLRMMTHYAPGNLAAWEEVYKRWKYMTPTMIRLEEVEIQQDPKRGGAAWHDKIRNPALSRQQAQPPNHHHQQQHQQYQQQHQHQQQMMMMDEDKFAEWQNYAGFLAALGGICLMADAGRQEPRRMSTPSESITMVNRFVVDMVDLLLCENIVVREWVKEILGMDLSPALYSMLFRYMETVLAKYFGPDGDPICNASNTLFVEQAISVLKLILDRMEGAFENLLTVDFSSLIDQYAKYLNKLGNGQSALKIKIKFCQLTEVLMIKKDKVTLRQEFRLRNKLLEIIVEWTSDFSLKPDLAQYSTSFESTQGEKLHRELDLACLNTIVGLLHQLPLQSPDPIHENDSTPVKSRIFFKYFTFFLKLLNRCRDSETDDATQRRLYLEHSKKSSVSTYLAPLKESTILAMSNLLSANVDAGLKHSLSMGYHDDPQMRTAFMKVLTNILNQGTEFETLAETVMTDRYEKVVDMLAGPDFHISLSLCDTCPSADIDDAANALLACFASRGKTLDLLKAVIQKEVQNTDTETELLRRTSIATRLLSVFAKQNGTDYVKSTLQPVFLKLAEKPAEEKTFELDPSKVSSNEDVSRNKQNVVSATEMFLNAICESANEAPRAFREVCHCILSSVRERYPEAKYTAVGAFIFLRFFCPAIVSPESEGLIKPSMIVSRDMKRGHLIATKVIQNLANNVLFGAKETYMIVLNDFLTSNIYKVTSFLREISDIPKETEDTPLEIRPMEQKDYTILHRVLFDNMERISRELATRRMRQYVDQDTAVQIKQQFDKFSNLMAQLGRSPEVAKSEFGLKSYTFAAANQLYADFMRRNTHRSVDSIVSKSIFYEGGVSKLNRPVFYYIARNVNADSIDFELLVYHILQTLERASSKSIEIVFDSTLFSSANEISTQFIIQFTQLLPFDVYDNITNFIIYNPSTELKKTVKRLPQPISHKLAK
ncbi:Ras GTPase activating protein ira2, partial [Rhizopus stolonifer]